MDAQTHGDWLKTFCQCCKVNKATDGAWCDSCHPRLIAFYHFLWSQPGTATDDGTTSFGIHEAGAEPVGSKRRLFTGRKRMKARFITGDLPADALVEKPVD